MLPQRARQWANKSWIPPFLAILPSLIMGVHLFFTANYALIDDGVSIVSARSGLAGFFKIGGGGRFMPGYWMYFWSILKIFPESPKALAFGTVVALIAGMYLCYRVAKSLHAPAWAAVSAAWLATLNIAQVEASYTLSKLENKQLVPWLIAFLVIAFALKEDGRLRALHFIALAIAATLVALTKETGILLLVSFFVLFLFALKDRVPGRRLLLLLLSAAAALPIIMAAIPAIRQLLSPTSYARDHVMQGEHGLSMHLGSLVAKDWPLSVLFLTGLLGGLWLCYSHTFPARRLAALLCVQLFVLIGFFSMISVVHPYYLVVPAAFAAILTVSAVGQLKTPSIRRIGVITIGVLTVWSADHSITSASALTGWSWLYGRLTHEVVTGHPRRVVFYASGGPEVNFEARLLWNEVMKVPVEIAALSGAPASSEAPVISARDLKLGDWIVEEFGDERNHAFPFRDLGVAWRTDFAIANDGLPVSLRHEYRATFPAFQQIRPPWRRKRTWLSWRISVVTATPHVIIEGLTLDHWMGREAKLWISESQTEDVRLRFKPFAPSTPDFRNRLVINGEPGVIAACEVGPSPHECVITARQFKSAPTKNGWIELRLSAEKTFNPLRLGLSADPRDFSFNFNQIYSAK